MEEERIGWIKYVGKSIYDHLFLSVDMNAYLSWGVSKPTITLYRDMPSLAMWVNGLLHKGWVIISLNEGSDLYEVFLIGSDNATVIKHVKDIYNDQLGTIVDGLVEYPSGISREEYGAMLMEREEPTL